MKKDMRNVPVSRLELEEYCTEQADVIGYDAMRDWLFRYAEDAQFDDGAWSYYHMIMVAY